MIYCSQLTFQLFIILQLFRALTSYYNFLIDVGKTFDVFIGLYKLITDF